MAELSYGQLTVHSSLCSGYCVSERPTRTWPEQLYVFKCKFSAFYGKPNVVTELCSVFEHFSYCANSIVEVHIHPPILHLYNTYNKDSHTVECRPSEVFFNHSLIRIMLPLDSRSNHGESHSRTKIYSSLLQGHSSGLFTMYSPCRSTLY